MPVSYSSYLISACLDEMVDINSLSLFRFKSDKPKKRAVAKTTEVDKDLVEHGRPTRLHISSIKTRTYTFCVFQEAGVESQARLIFGAALM